MASVGNFTIPSSRTELKDGDILLVITLDPSDQKYLYCYNWKSFTEQWEGDGDLVIESYTFDAGIITINLGYASKPLPTLYKATYIPAPD